MAGLVDELRPGRRKPELVLSEAERAELTRWVRRAKTAQFLALRARIVLRCAEGGTNKEIAAELGVSQGTVNRWRSRFISAFTRRWVTALRAKSTPSTRSCESPREINGQTPVRKTRGPSGHGGPRTDPGGRGDPPPVRRLLCLL
jgi:hypothetical protein